MQLNFEALPELVITKPYTTIPAILKERLQWCVSAPNKIPMHLDEEGVFVPASSTDPSTWMSFEKAVEIANILSNYDIGFMLQQGDGITCVDLDFVDAETQLAKGKPVDSSQWTTQAEIDRYNSIVKELNSYTETSRSGKGLHIWVLGEIGKGRRRDRIEVYSQERYMICTGSVANNVGLQARQEILDVMIQEMGEVGAAPVTLVEVGETYTDEVLWERAATANNDKKFKELCEGLWKELGYGSQSEADLALMSMFTFYSTSNAQCMRMFRMTELGKREKAVKNDVYLNRTLALIRGRQAKEKEIDDINAKALDTMYVEWIKKQEASTAENSTLNGIAYPPGFVGTLARFIFDDSYLRIKEVAISAALALLAGVCGRGYLTPTRKDLSLYTILVANTGIGKDSIHTGIHKLIELSAIPQATYFVRANDYASGPALQKKILKAPGFLYLQGEFGRKLKGMASPTNTPLQDLRTVMTNAYSKELLEGKSYSDALNDIPSVRWPALSFLGETTPDTFTSAMTPDMMEDGFLSRFLIISYLGERPQSNQQAGNITLKPEDLEQLRAIINKAVLYQGTSSNFERIITHYSSTEVAQMFIDFENTCREHINSTQDNYERQTWNRAHIKTLKVASLLACADNWEFPSISKADAEWAIDLVKRDIAYFQQQYHSGNIGQDDNARENKIIHLCKKYLHEKPSHSYKIPDALWEARIVPRAYFQKQVSQTNAFVNHRNNSNFALDSTLKNLISSGYIEEQDQARTKETYQFNGKCYKIDISKFL